MCGAGGIPVFFASCARPDLLYETVYHPFLPRHERTAFGAGSWAVLLNSSRVGSEPGYVWRELRAIAADARALRRMRATIIRAMPRLQYPTWNSTAHLSRRYMPDSLAVLHSVLHQRGLGELMRDRPGQAWSPVRRGVAVSLPEI